MSTWSITAPGQLEYDLVLAPGADPQVIRLAFEGADRMTLDDTGNLVLALGEQQVIQHSPRVYQETNGERTAIPTRYVLADNRQVSLAIGDYDAGRALVIDPVLVYSTYLGGIDADAGNATGVDEGMGIAADSAGNAYLTGWTASPDFPIHHALQPEFGGYTDAYVAKLSADGTTLVYASYLGGGGLNEGFGIAVDGAGNAYLTGRTYSTDFPTLQAVQPELHEYTDGFVAKIADVPTVPEGALPWLAALGGLAGDGNQHLAVLFGDAAAGTVTARIKDSVAGTLIQTLVFDPAYAPWTSP